MRCIYTQTAILAVLTFAVLIVTFGTARADGDKAAELYSESTPNSGFRLAETENGNLTLRIYTYVRYLNQKGLDSTYSDAFGNTKTVQQRQDIQFQKVNIKFHGWLMDPRFKYLVYVWTANTSQGLGAQVIAAGNLNYAFNNHVALGGGVNALPGVRATEGNFPFWLTVDNRLIADEFFRPSYTMGIWAKGDVVDRLVYHVMLGNNLSQLGIDAGQLDGGLNTVSAALMWFPTTGEFGTWGGFGDFGTHKEMATRLGVHFTRSDENRQSQPHTEGFENTQIRLSDGNVIFQPDLFGDGIQIEDAAYHMLSVDLGAKYRGFSLEGEYYWRWVNNLRGSGTDALTFDELTDNGFQVQASAMVLPATLQLYLSGSKIFGEYGNPWDARLGLNWFPWRNRIVRWNFEYLHLNHSPVGALSLPYAVGGNGDVFYTSFEVNW